MLINSIIRWCALLISIIILCCSVARSYAIDKVINGIKYQSIELKELISYTPYFLWSTYPPTPYDGIRVFTLGRIQFAIDNQYNCVEMVAGLLHSADNYFGGFPISFENELSRDSIMHSCTAALGGKESGVRGYLVSMIAVVYGTIHNVAIGTKNDCYLNEDGFPYKSEKICNHISVESIEILGYPQGLFGMHASIAGDLLSKYGLTMLEAYIKKKL